eukprot:gene1240-11329_t
MLNLEKEEKRILIFSTFIRLTILVLTKIYDLLIMDYDSSSFIIHKENSLFRQLTHWDSTYFLEISETGYQYEHFHAFLPLYPLFIRILKFILTFFLKYILFEREIHSLSGILISNIFFILSTIFMYRLSNHFLKDKKLSKISTLLYSINPASIFLSCVYTESSFALFSLMGLYFLFVKKNQILTPILFSISTGIRSNGTILSGFFIFNFLKNKFSMKEMILTIVQCIITIFPFITYQYFGYALYCGLETKRPWCSFIYPNLYGFVQSEYWKVGFLKYYEFKQIPNFLLASPILILSFYGIYLYTSKNSKLVFSLGLRNFEETKTKKGKGFFNEEIVVFIFYWLFLTIYILLNAHVQIITRFFASMPPLFWFCSFLYLKKKYFWKKFILGFFIFYSFLGCILFSNFYPWT